MTKDEVMQLAKQHAREYMTFQEAKATKDLSDAIDAAIKEAVAAERERCAKVCEDKAKQTFSGQCQVWGDYFARAIRKGEQE